MVPQKGDPAMDFRFGPAVPEDAEEIFGLIRQRLAWMEERGIRQWQADTYWEIFPPSHYYDAIAQGRLMVLRVSEGGPILSAGVLASEDHLWPDGGKAFYLHNFVTALSAPGAGSLFLRHCEDYARSCGKDALRLDCDAANQPLNDYYARQGYEPRGTLMNGDDLGRRWEKRLTSPPPL